MRKSLILMTFAAAVLTILSVSALVCAEVVLEDDFSDPANTGQMWEAMVWDLDWKSASAQWSDQADVKDGLLTIKNVGTGTNRFVLMSEPRIADYIVEAKMKINILAGTGHAGFYLDMGDDSAFVLMVRREGRLIWWARGDAEHKLPPLSLVELGKWHVIKMEVKGKNVKVYSDDVLLGDFEFENMTPARIGVCVTMGNAQFDYVRVTRN